jgi:hypothetical protein
MTPDMTDREREACACLNVSYSPTPNADGSFSERWVCSVCGAEFQRGSVKQPKPSRPRESYEPTDEEWAAVFVAEGDTDRVRAAVRTIIANARFEADKQSAPATESDGSEAEVQLAGSDWVNPVMLTGEERKEIRTRLDALRERIRLLEAENFRLDECRSENVKLRAENARLHADNEAYCQHEMTTAAELLDLKQENARLKADYAQLQRMHRQMCELAGERHLEIKQLTATLSEALEFVEEHTTNDGHPCECKQCRQVREFRTRTAKAEPESAARPRIVCLCGSTRFYQQFKEANYRETMAGKIVLSVGFYPHAQVQEHGQHIGVTDEQKLALDELHKRKIDLADEVLVLNVGGYIGSSTRGEIEHAKKTGKTIRYLSVEEDPVGAAEAFAAMNGDIPEAAPQSSSPAAPTTPEANRPSGVVETSRIPYLNMITYQLRPDMMLLDALPEIKTAYDRDLSRATEALTRERDEAREVASAYAKLEIKMILEAGKARAKLAEVEAKLQRRTELLRETMGPLSAALERRIGAELTTDKETT